MHNYNECKLVYPKNCLKTNNEYFVDITEIVRQKHIIPIQYETINIGGNSDDLHQLSKKLDRYLLHIIEEITEFLEEIDKLILDKHSSSILHPIINDDCLMELIDVSAYISSVLSILYIDLYGLKNTANGLFDINNENNIIDMTIYDSTYENESSVKNIINDVLMEVEKILLLNIRRKFPERKWHKDTDRILSIMELKSLYEECIKEISDALCKIISLFLFLTNNNYDLFTEMFLKKNEIVYSLKDKK